MTNSQDRSWYEATSEQLESAGYPHLAVRIRVCHAPDEIVAIRRCSHNQSHYNRPILYRCRLAICPYCSWLPANDRVRRFGDFPLRYARSKRRNYGPYHITLTTKLMLGEANHREAYRRIWPAVEKTVKAAMFSEIKARMTKEERYKVKFSWPLYHAGYVAASDWGPKGGKLHFHLFYYGPRLDHALLKEKWAKFTANAGKNVRLRPIARHRDALDQALIYVAELSPVEPALTPQLLAVLKKTRRIRSKGIFTNIPKLPAPSPQLCPHCNARIRRTKVAA